MRLVFFSFLFLVIGCAPTQKMPHHNTFDLQGHRGCRGLMPENTIPAMLHALELGVTTLEMDAVITADSQVLLSHEPFFNHEISTKPDGNLVAEREEKGLNIYRMSYPEVQRYDVGLRPHPRFPQQKKMAAVKPLLADVFAAVKGWCADHNKPIPFFNIETKCLPITDNLYHPRPDRFVQLLMAVVVKADMQNHTIIQSFDYRTLQVVHRSYPTIQTAALVEEGDTVPLQTQLQQLGFVPHIYSPHYSLVTPQLVQQCKTGGIRLVPWTVNEVDDMQRLQAMGVDGLITDYPDRFKRQKP